MMCGLPKRARRANASSAGDMWTVAGAPATGLPDALGLRMAGKPARWPAGEHADSMPRAVRRLRKVSGACVFSLLRLSSSAAVMKRMHGGRNANDAGRPPGRTRFRT